MSELSHQDQKVHSDIAEHGCHIIHVPSDETGPGFSYSIGLYHNFKHPEVIFIGMKPDLTDVLINNICYDLKEGLKFEAGKSYGNILDDFQCFMIEVRKQHYKEYFGYANWFYKSDDFPVLQCVYPTVNGVYPWDENAPEGFKEHQVLLGALAK